MQKPKRSIIDEKLIRFLDSRIKKLFDLGMEKKNKRV
jgi:hypothetical protein